MHLERKQMAYKRLSDKKFREQLLDKKVNSVLCSCGHRIFMRTKKYAVCWCCGKKHISPKEQFKIKFKEYLKTKYGIIIEG